MLMTKFNAPHMTEARELKQEGSVTGRELLTAQLL